MFKSDDVAYVIVDAIISPNNLGSLVPHLINVIGEYSPLFFGLLLVCGIAAIQSSSIIYLSSSALLTRDILKRFFIRNMNNNEQIFAFRIILMIIFIAALVISIKSSSSIFDLGSFALSIACQMFVPLMGHAMAISKTTGPHALSYFLTINYNFPHGIAVGWCFVFFGSKTLPSTLNLIIDQPHEEDSLFPRCSF